MKQTVQQVENLVGFTHNLETEAYMFWFMSFKIRRAEYTKSQAKDQLIKIKNTVFNRTSKWFHSKILELEKINDARSE